MCTFSAKIQPQPAARDDSFIDIILNHQRKAWQWRIVSLIAKYQVNKSALCTERPPLVGAEMDRLLSIHVITCYCYSYNDEIYIQTHTCHFLSAFSKYEKTCCREQCFSDLRLLWCLILELFSALVRLLCLEPPLTLAYRYTRQIRPCRRFMGSEY